MEDTTLFKIALTTSLIGIYLLLVVVGGTDIDHSDISSINLEILNSNVRVKGTISNSIDKQGLSIIYIEDKTGKIPVIAYTNNLGLKKGKLIEVQGKVIEYKQKPEIQASLIKVL